MLKEFEKWKVVPSNPEAWLRWFMTKKENQEAVDEAAKALIIDYLARVKAREILEKNGYDGSMPLGSKKNK